MITVGLTGNAAAGKSRVADAWRQAGIPVVSADELARQAVAPGSPGLAEVVAAFGEGVLTPDGSLDRARVRDRVFRDADARTRLEAIVHPRVRAARDRWLDELAAEGAPLAAAEIPLLFETGAHNEVDRVVVVDAPEAERLRRLVEVRGLDRDEARRLMAAQGDPAAKRARADQVIDNAGDLDGLRREAARVLAALLPPASGPAWVAPDFQTRPPPGWMRVDLHLHTRASWDSLSDPEALLERARARGVSRLGITDHDTLPLALELARRHPEAVIPGEEVRTAEGIDVIGLYLREPIPRGTPAREVIRRVREQGGIAYLPHPYAPGKGGGGRLAEELAPLVDVVEVFNARLHPEGRNRPAAALAERWGRLHGAGSDAHTVGEVAGAWVELPEHPNTPDGLRRALLRGRPAGREASRLVHLAST
ncbi:MAG: dephospho-CoA kinase, partial [Longimicrobiales bacterium]|nr:dephospho-CoA kinase [Longimicrobiales bacterium]